MTQFTELLFADQTLDTLLASLEKKGSGVWDLLIRAAEDIRQGESKRATQVLFEIVDNPANETRVVLWAWTALRSLGVSPASYKIENVIKGVVIQMPMKNGFDTLAAYADGTARYVNYSGRIIIWDIDDIIVKNTIERLLTSCKDLQKMADAATDNHPVSNMVRITLLTIYGNRSIKIPKQSVTPPAIQQILSIGAQLMIYLMKQTELANKKQIYGPKGTLYRFKNHF